MSEREPTKAQLASIARDTLDALDIMLCNENTDADWEFEHTLPLFSDRLRKVLLGEPPTRDRRKKARK